MTYSLLKTVRIALVMCCGMTVSACSLLAPVKVDTPNKYVLDQVPHHIGQKNQRAGTLLVMAPETRQVYNTTQMAYMTRPFQVGYFSQNEWGETPSQMLQPLIVETLHKTHTFHAIVTPPYLGSYDYSLYTDILEIVQDYTVHPAVSVVTIRAVLTRFSSNRVVATAQFSEQVPIRPQSPYSGVLAANQANEKILAQIAEFCRRNVR